MEQPLRREYGEESFKTISENPPNQKAAPKGDLK
jgi:hypothetical protein